MQEGEENKESNIKATIDAVTGLAKAVPVYNDAIQPAAKEVGKALGTVTKTVNIALAPIKALIWGYDKIETFVNNKVSEKLSEIPEERIITPPPEVVGPALESLRFTGHQEELRNLFANLIANSMDSVTLKNAHPGFVEVIKNLSSEDAKILKLFTQRTSLPLIDIRSEFTQSGKGGRDLVINFSNIGELSGCNDISLVPSFLDNLCRLGLLHIPTNMHLIDDDLYKPLEESTKALSIKESLEKTDDQRVKFVRKYATLTTYGRQFCNTCVKDK
jgi:hypothetical protein